MQTARDTYNQLEYAKKKGREEGIEKRSREIAANMLRKNVPIESICEFTCLSAEEISKLQSEP